MMLLLGSQVPTFEAAPDCTTNAAGEVCEFMASLGRPQDEWQRRVLELWLGEDRTGLWTAFELWLWLQRQNGKGDPLVARELAGLFLFGEQRLIHTAHKSETVQAAWKRTLELVDGSDDLLRRLSPRQGISRKDGEEGLRLRSGAELQFRVRSGRGKGRGLTGNFVGLDEALYLTAADLEAFGPTMLAQANAQVAYTSTAPLDPESPIISVRERAHAGAERMAGAEWVSPPGVDLDDPAVLAAVNPMYGRRITPERMRDMRRLLGPDGYARECGGIWPDPATGRSIDPRRWAELQDSGSRRAKGGVTAVGVSIAPMRDVAAVVLFGTRADGLGHVQLVDLRLGVAWLVNRLVEWLDSLRPALVGMTRGTAASLGPELAEAGITVAEDPERPAHGDLVTLAGPELAAGCGQLMDAVRQRSLRVAPSPDLDAAVAGTSTRVLGDGITWVRRGLGTEAAPLEAATIARAVHVSRAGLLVEGEYNVDDVLASVY